MRFLRKEIRYQLLLASIVLFNAGLCFLCNYVEIVSGHVIFFQVLTFLWLVIEMLIGKMFSLRDYLFLLLIFLAILGANLMDENFSPKSFFDGMILPVTVIFGFKCGLNYWAFLKRLFLLIFSVSFIEYFFSSLYLKLFPVGKYYFTTRVWVGEKEIDVDELTFYIGAYRAGGSKFFTDHRLASLLLDPITYGYFSVLVAYSAIIWERRLFWRVMYILFALGMALVADTRIAVVLITFGLFFNAMRWLRSYPLPLYLVLIWLFYFFIMNYVGNSAGDLGYRLSLTYEGLQGSSFTSLLGIGEVTGKTNDSGYLYLLNKMGLGGVLISYLFFYDFYIRHGNRKYNDVFVLVMTFFSVTLFFGAACLSVKVAVLWGVFLGCSVRLFNQLVGDSGQAAQPLYPPSNSNRYVASSLG